MMNQHDKSFQQAMSEMHGRLTCELQALVTERVPKAMGATVESAVADIDNQQMRKVAFDILTVTKCVAYLVTLQEMGYMSTEEWHELQSALYSKWTVGKDAEEDTHSS